MATPLKYDLNIEGSAFFKRVKPIAPFKFHVVDLLEESKPWLIADRNGLQKEAWEIVLRTNNITNPFDIEAGRLLLIPRPEEIEEAQRRIR